MRTLIIATVVALAACGGKSVLFEDYAVAAREAYCRHLVACSEVENVETCQNSNVGIHFGFSASQKAAVLAGMSEYDGESAAACFDALGSRSCDPTSAEARGTPDACLDVFHGTLPANAVCGVDEECISQDCEVTACDMACCTGVCVGDTRPVRGKVGDPCGTVACEDRLFCDRGIATCVALRGLGGFCVSTDQCDVGLYCDGSGECAARLPALGEPCTAGCRDEGTQCDAITRTCIKVALGGAACAMTSDCSLLYRCDATKHCSPGVALGNPCGGGERCADDRVFCEIPPGEVTGTCVLPRDNDVACVTNENCTSFYCSPSTHTCADEPVCL